MKRCRPTTALSSGIGAVLDKGLCNFGMVTPGCLLEQCPLLVIRVYHGWTRSNTVHFKMSPRTSKTA